MKQYVIALDQGTTSSRSIIFDREQNIIGVAQREFTQHYPKPGWVEHDPMEIWSSQYSVLTEALAQSGVSPEEIADLARSKRYAHARLRRMVMCAALGVRAGDADSVPPYIRTLGFDARGAALLREMKTRAALPVIIKSARIRDENETARHVFDLGSRAHDLLVLGWQNRAAQAADSDYRATPYASVHDNQERV